LKTGPTENICSNRIPQEREKKNQSKSIVVKHKNQGKISCANCRHARKQIKLLEGAMRDLGVDADDSVLRNVEEKQRGASLHELQSRVRVHRRSKLKLKLKPKLSGFSFASGYACFAAASSSSSSSSFFLLLQASVCTVAPESSCNTCLRRFIGSNF